MDIALVAKQRQAMRLLKVSKQDCLEELPTLVEFSPDNIPPYAILSHRWNASPTEEIQYVDLLPSGSTSKHALRAKQGYQKVQFSCVEARRRGLDYLWIDTCCIDKSSSAELSEAINSMYNWYSKAQVCFGYLADVPSTVDLTSHDSELTRTEWATRGWTLQELLAPREMIFYSRQWRPLGTKESLSKILSAITGIDEEYLRKEAPRPVSSASIAKRMSWAAKRKTTRPEDIAYCLMGIFQVNMPMLYGEGEKAFIRLQEEIMKHSDDMTLLAWTSDAGDKTARHGLLAKHPYCFTNSGNFVSYEVRASEKPFSMSNKGLQIQLRISPLGSRHYAAALDCPVPPAYKHWSSLAVHLEKLPYSSDQYARVDAGHLHELVQEGSLETIFVRHSTILPDADGFLRAFTLQCGGFIPRSLDYHLLEVVKYEKGKDS